MERKWDAFVLVVQLAMLALAGFGLLRPPSGTPPWVQVGRAAIIYLMGGATWPTVVDAIARATWTAWR